MQQRPTLLTLLLAITFTLSLAGQRSPWPPGPVPTGEYDPYELIISLTESFEPRVIEAAFATDFGLEVEAFAINTTQTDYLVRILAFTPERLDEHNRTQRERTENEDPDPGTTLELPTVCDIIFNPGGDGPLGKVEDPDAAPNNELTSPTEPLGSCVSPGMFSSDPAPFGNGPFDPFHLLNPGPEMPYIVPDPATVDRLEQVKIAILDTGISTEKFGNFFDYGNASIVEWSTAELAPDPNAVSPVNTDPHGHGTAMGYLAAYDFVNKGLQDNVRLRSYRVLNECGVGTLAGLLFALDQAIEDDVDVITLSLGFRFDECGDDDRSLINEYFNRARENDIFVFCSAGNDGANLHVSPQHPAANTLLSNVYTIGAENYPSGNLWNGSNYGDTWVDRTAPGNGLLCPWALGPTDENGIGHYLPAAGTSFSTPLVAGLAANYVLFEGYDMARCRLETNTLPGEPEPVSHLSRKGSIFNIEFTDECQSHEEAIFSASSTPISLPAGTALAYPNPFHDLLTVATASPDGGTTSIRLLDQEGRTVLSLTGSSPSLSLNTAALPPGIYFLRTTNDTEIKVRKVIKQ